MPDERGYTRQIMPRAAAPMPRPSAAQYGAEFGAELERTGETWHREALEDYAIERQKTADEELTGFLRGYAAHQENIDGIVREARKDGSTGHTIRMGEAWEAARGALLDGITDDRVRRRADQMFSEGGVRFRTGERTFEEASRVQRVTSDFSDWRSTTANRVRRLEKADDYTAAQREAAEAIDALDVGQDVKDKLHDETGQVYAISFLQGQIDRDPAVAKALVTAGAFDDVLEPQQVEALLNKSDVEIRSRAVVAAREASETKAAIREQIQTLEEADRQGITVPDEKYEEAAQLAQTLGDDSLSLKIEGLRSNSRLAKVYEGASPVQREQRQAELAGKADRTVEEDRELKWLDDHRGALDGRFNTDPAGFAAEAGEAPPPLDRPLDRARWARERSEAYGRPVPPITKNEAAQLQANFRAGRAGAVEVMDLLSTMPAAQAAQAARLVDPNDETLAVMVTLPKPYRQLALDGRDAGKARPGLVRDALRDDARLKEKTEGYDAQFEEALRSVPPAQRAAIKTVGARILFGMLDQSGGELTANAYWKAMNMALGQRTDGATPVGGLGRWGERPFLLPDGVSGAAFGNTARRLAAQDDGPVNPDGTPATIAGAYPVAIGNGLYEFRTAGGAVLKTRKRVAWQIRVSAK